MTFNEFIKLDKREVNRLIANKLGFICNDNWDYNQNAMRGGSGSESWANLTLLRNKDDEYFSHVGWNPFYSSESALQLVVDFGLILDLGGFTIKEARDVIVWKSYLECIK